MRIVSFFVQTIIAIGVIAAVVYFFGGQMWMAVSLSSFLADVKTLESTSTNVTTLRKKCQAAPAASQYSYPKAVQLRFLDDKQYTIEVICSLIETTPVELSTGTLPALITKNPGSSGFFVDLQNPGTSAITLHSLHANKTFVFTTKLEPAGTATPPPQNVPQTACAGWGLRCCQAPEEQGQGTQQSIGVTDCPATCFSACSSLPVVVAFTSDPYPSQNNTVEMSGPTLTVTFSYTTENAGGTIKAVQVQYGDGSGETSTQPVGVFSHTYTCAGPCSFTATLTAQDAQGNSSVASGASTIYIEKK